MTRTRKVFITELKHDAAYLILVQNYTYIRAYKIRGASHSSSALWVIQLKQERLDNNPTHAKALASEQKEIQRL